MVRSNEDKRARRLARHAAKMQREQDKAAMYKRRREEARESVGIDMGFVGLLASIAAKKAARDGHPKAETTCQEPQKDREEGVRRAWTEAGDAILEAGVVEDEKAD